MSQENIEEQVQLVELSPGEIPSHWRDIPFKVLQYAMTFGLIIPDYTCRNYIELAVEKGGYETLEVWGVQGSAKSNRTLQHGYWVYGDWDEVLKHLVFKPSGDVNFGFVERLKSIPHGKRIPWLGWDDITVHFPSSSWRTQMEQYEAVDSSWAAIRTKVNVVSLNSPLIDRLPKNIKDNITMEVFLGRNQVELVERIVRLPGLKMVESNFFKIQVEPLHKFDMYDVPTDVFKEYWEMRLTLADEAIQKLGDVFSRGEKADLENYIPASAIAKEFDLSPFTVVRMVDGGLVRNKKVAGQLYILKEDYEAIIKPHYSKHGHGKAWKP
jgi:hypothetical protein